MTQPASSLSSVRTIGTFLHGRACSDTLFHVINRAFGQEPQEQEEQAVQTFAGGIMQHGYQCGMLWGAVLAAGSEAFRRYGPGAEAEARALSAAKNLVESFRAKNKHINCMDITEIDKSSTAMEMIKTFLLKGSAFGCLKMAGKYGHTAFDEIDRSFSSETADIPEAPVSCAAVVAEKMGATGEQQAMAAGLAGGIGLCGGVCGALGAAIWLTGIKIQQEDGVKNLWNDDSYNSRFSDLMERYLQAADFEFECEKACGRKFADVNDHAAYLKEGGCAGIIEELAK